MSVIQHIKKLAHSLSFDIAGWVISWFAQPNKPNKANNANKSQCPNTLTYQHTFKPYFFLIKSQLFVT